MDVIHTMMAICSAVSLNDSSCEFLWASSFILVEMFIFLVVPFVSISRWGMLEYNEGYITGIVSLSLVNTEVNWLFRAFALSRSFVIGLSFTIRVGIPTFSRWFALMKVRNRCVFVFRLLPMWLFT